jgi:hypothetical protein
MIEVIVVRGVLLMTVPTGGVPCGGIVYVEGGPRPKTAVVTYDASWGIRIVL